MLPFTQTAYHGTFWEDDTFDRPSPGYSDYGAAYATNSRNVAEWFCTWNSPMEPEDVTFVIMRGEIELKRPYIYSQDTHNSPYIELGEAEYNVGDDRDELYPALQRCGYDGFVIQDNYPDGNDIAYFDENQFTPRDYKLSPDGKTWSDWMSYDEAVEFVEQRQLDRHPDPEPDSPDL